MKKYILTLVSLLCTVALFAQGNITASGFVQDATSKQGISGVTVRSTKLAKVVGTTDRKGYFRVSIPADDEIQFSNMEYEVAKESLVGKKLFVFTVYLDKKQNALEEVVVQGYTSRTRETMTGSTVRIDGKQLQDNPVSNVMQMLQGKVAGMNIQLNSGQPGTRTSVMVRGLSNISMNGAGADGFLTPTSPLYVVDGAQVDDNTDFNYGFSSQGAGISPISLIPPEDIESIDVLKDAAATALYGSRGAYGVIIITTKRGKSKTPIIQYTTNQFFNTVPNLRDVLGGVNERYSRINQIMNYGGDIWAARDEIQNSQLLSDSLNPYYNNSTNWQDVFYKSTYNQTHNVNASGGDVTFNYKINGSFYNEKGIIQNTGFSRYTLNMQSEYRPSERFRLSGIMSGNFGKQKVGSGNSVTQGGVASAASASSLLPSPSSSFISNDILAALTGRNDDRTNDLRATLDLDFEVLKGLRASNNFSYSYNTTRKDLFTPAIANDNISSAYNFDGQRNTLYNLTRLNYIKDFKRHMLLAYVFSELNMTDFMSKAMKRSGFANDQLEGPFGFNAGNALGGILNNTSEVRSAGFAGAASLNLFDKKYVLDFTYRFDKSSAVGAEVPWVKNPSISARWNMEKEEFMSFLTESGTLDYLALRGSWGKNIVPTGTVFDANGKYQYTGFFNNNQTIGFSWGQMPNTRLVPSTTTQMSGALEFGLYGGRINATLETYYKQVDNMLWTKPLTNHNAFGEIKTNEVSTVNYGYEFDLRFRPLRPESEWKWDVTLTGAWNDDILTSLPDGKRTYTVYDNNLKYHTLYRLGRNSMSFVLFDYRGTFATDAEVPVNPSTGEPYKTAEGYYFQGGDPYWTDLNGDYILDDQDLVVVGNAQPKMTGGINTNLRYKGFSLTTQLSYTYKRDVINAALAAQMASYGTPFGKSGGRKESALLPLDRYDFWTTYGQIAGLPNPFDYQRTAIRPFRANQTLFMEDGSYLKINYVTLGYNFPRQWTERYNVTSARVYVTGNNLYTFSNYSGPNPELVTSSGYDRTDGYPTARSFTLGLSLQF
ncbi:TonB-linked outer membrane protein, SusC/RagA family [Sphingobacterium nematocida]|uniref:TonB-linked outer membrane protein, SusC/RagA family n=1 Tax=Sphingobacterium nematocida TaxID=1513896 RepID=A0A1T5C5R1_9SPHI|nr:SusC/RagA family TonB-linked outer membrane protein [Sphingobacterium nematocida]SKB54679.1 TonB-linked outer membrane protein, SusC/RagA family [Sphingobacterium nematocida]